MTTRRNTSTRNVNIVDLHQAKRISAAIQMGRFSDSNFLEEATFLLSVTTNRGTGA